MNNEQLGMKIQTFEEIQEVAEFIDALRRTILADTTDHERDTNGSSTTECAMRHVVFTNHHLPTPLSTDELAQITVPFFEALEQNGVVTCEALGQQLNSLFESGVMQEINNLVTEGINNIRNNSNRNNEQ